MLMDNMEYFTQRLQCTNAEKDACLKTVVEVLHLWKVIRKDGLLALGYTAADQERDPFFRACLRDASDMLGMDSEPQMEGLFKAYLAAGDYQGAAFLRSVVIAEGVLLIAKVLQELDDGTPGRDMPSFRKWGEELFLAVRGYFGAEYRDKVDKTILREVQKYEKDVQKTSHIPDFDALAELPRELCVQLWQDVPEVTMGIALKYAGAAAWDRLMSALPSDRQEEMMDKMEWLTLMRQTDVENAQREILEKAASYGGIV